MQSSFRDSMYCSTISASISSGSETVALDRTEICLLFSVEFFFFFRLPSDVTFHHEHDSTPGEFLFAQFSLCAVCRKVFGTLPYI